jgi:hypothetical protein
VKQKPGREIPESWRNREANVPRFASDTPIWPTSNIPERGVRPLNAQQKIIGCLTSDDVTQNRLDAHGHIDNARKHGSRALGVLEQFTLGHPRMPRPSRSHRAAKATHTTSTPSYLGECLLER